MTERQQELEQDRAKRQNMEELGKHLKERLSRHGEMLEQHQSPSGKLGATSISSDGLPTQRESPAFCHSCSFAPLVPSALAPLVPFVLSCRNACFFYVSIWRLHCVAFCRGFSASILGGMRW